MKRGWVGRLVGAAALVSAVAASVPAAASAADPDRWEQVGRQSIPFAYFQGITSDPGTGTPTSRAAGDLFFDGPSFGVFRTNALLSQEASNPNVIPPAVSAAPNSTTPAAGGEGYNHLGDITYDPADGGRVLLSLECYYPGTPGGGNTCKTGAVGVADLDGNWDYYVRLDTDDIRKTMWIESSDDGTELYTQGGSDEVGSGAAGRDLLVYSSADVTEANESSPGSLETPIQPIAEYTNALPGDNADGSGGVSQMTGATYFRDRLYVARSIGASGLADTFQVWSLDPDAGTDAQVEASRRLEIEIPVAGESEGLDVNPSFGSVLDWQIMPIPRSPATQPATYQPGVGSLVSFVPEVGGADNGDIVDTDGDGVADGNEGSPTCVNQPGNLANGCLAGTPDPGDEDLDRINTNGVLTPPDNCSGVANNFQANADGDSQGDACDTNDDNDSVLDVADNCDFVPNNDQADADGDGIGNACEDDDDNDGTKDYYDNCPVNPNPDQADADGDGVGDACKASPPPPVPADTTPPGTNIGKVKVKGTKATIVFATDDPAGGTYECKLDGKPIKGECDSPLKLKKLKPGKRKFQVAAVDLAGNVDPTPAKATLKVNKPKKKK